MGHFTQLMMMAILVTAVSCNKGGGGGGGGVGGVPAQEQSPHKAPEVSPPTPAPTPTPTTPSTPAPTTPTTPSTGTSEPKEDVILIRAAAEFIDMEDEKERKDKLERSIQLLETILNNPLFRQRILAYTYKGVKAFVDNDGKTNAQIFQTIHEASEELTPARDHTINVQLTFYYASNSTVGYTTPTTRLIKMNTKFFDQYTRSEVAGNLAHEWMHKLGYGHASRYSESRDHSVPYAVGYMVSDMGEDIEGE